MDFSVIWLCRATAARRNLKAEDFLTSAFSAISVLNVLRFGCFILSFQLSSFSFRYVSLRNVFAIGSSAFALLFQFCNCFTRAFSTAASPLRPLGRDFTN